jgi:hypothetical protein
MLRFPVAALILQLAAAPPVAAAASTTSFARDVMPVLDRYCVHCHSGARPHGGLRLDRYEALLRGGDSGPAVIAGNPRASLLVAKIERRNRPPMPPKRALPRAAVAKLRAWIAAGAAP